MGCLGLIYVLPVGRMRLSGEQSKHRVLFSNVRNGWVEGHCRSLKQTAMYELSLAYEFYAPLKIPEEFISNRKYGASVSILFIAPLNPIMQYLLKSVP